MYLNEYSLLATAVLLITSFFLLFIYRKRTATIAAYRLYELSLLLLIWQFFTWFNWVFRLDKSIHLWTVAFNGFVSTYLGLFFLRFVVSFLEIRFPKSLLQVVWIWTSVCAVFILIGRYVYVDIVLSFWGWSPVYGRWFGLIVGTLLAEMGLSVFFVVRHYSTALARQKKSLRVWIIVLFCVLTVGTFTNLVLPWLGYIVLPLAGVASSVLLITFYITMHHWDWLSLRMRSFSIQSKIMGSFIFISTVISSLFLLTLYVVTFQLRHAGHQLASEFAFTVSPYLQSQTISQAELITLLEQSYLRQVEIFVLSNFWKFAAIMFALIGIGVFISYKLGKSLTDPLLVLVRHAEKLSHSYDYSQRLEITGNDEIAFMTATFNRMSGRLHTLLTRMQETIDSQTKELTMRLGREHRALQKHKELVSNVRDMNATLAIKQKELRSANSKLRELDQLKSEFLSNVSHELRTPLTSLRMYNQLLNDGSLGELNPQQKLAVGEILQSVDSLVILVNDLLDLKKIESGKMVYTFVPIPLMDVFDQVLLNLKALLLEFDTKVSITIDPAIHHVYVDKFKLAQVFQNLISNALKFNINNQPIEVEAHMLTRVKTHWVEISVRDHGQGMKKNELEHLFDRFYQARAGMTNKTRGTGLGLAISQEIVRAHGGYINVESTWEVGTTFTLLLPVKQK